jgi:hypothetical protein
MKFRTICVLHELGSFEKGGRVVGVAGGQSRQQFAKWLDIQYGVCFDGHRNGGGVESRWLKMVCCCVLSVYRMRTIYCAVQSGY